MTDATVPQLAFVAPVKADVDGHVPQLAFIAVCSETPPVAGGARIMQSAYVAVTIEFVIPKVPIPFGVPAFMQTFPYFIGE